MKRLLIFTIATILLSGGAVLTQTPTANVVANAEEQTRMRPLIAAETKAREALNVKIAMLPQAKAYKDAQDALQKAADALNKAAEALPESAVLREASKKTVDEAFRIQLAHNLSIGEYRPELNDKGELAFAKATPAKP